MSDFDVIIVGAGLIGAATALTLAQQDAGLKVALVERSSHAVLPAEPNQRVVALGGAAHQVLSKLGVFQSLGKACAYPYSAMRVWDEHSDGELFFSARDVSVDELGHMVDAQACTHALQQTAESGRFPNLSTFFNCDLRQLETNVADRAALLSDSFTLTAKLVIGADGANSWVRQQAGIFANKLNYQQRGIVANIRTANGHADCAWQRFLHGGPVAVLPLENDRASIVWSVSDARAKALLDLSEDDFALELAEALDMRLGAIDNVQRRVSFPLLSQRATRYFSESVALVGDAAHSIHPLAGQGANLGFKDLQAIGKMVQSDSPDNYQALGSLPSLQRYERSRKFDNEQTDTLMSLLHAAYQSQQPLWQQARGIGMNWVNRSDRLKAMLAQQAMT